MTTTTLPAHRSYSQVRQYRKCGQQYKLERVEKARSQPSCAAVAGVAVHVGTEAVDTLIHQVKTITRESLIEAGLRHAHEALVAETAKYAAKDWPTTDWRVFTRKHPHQDSEWFRDIGIPNSILAYVDWRLANPEFELVEVPGFGLAIEVPFNYYVDGQLVHGFIDRIFKVRDNYCPVDIKSGLKPETDEQLGLYGRALASALGWTVEWGFYLYELKKGVAKLTPPLSIAHWDDAKLGSVYIPATRGIDAGIFIPHPSPDNCRMCSVSEACDYARSVV